jgi:hypothetical protein
VDFLIQALKSGCFFFRECNNFMVYDATLCDENGVSIIIMLSSGLDRFFSMLLQLVGRTELLKC